MDVVRAIRTRTTTGDGQLADVTILADVGNAATGVGGTVAARWAQKRRRYADPTGPIPSGVESPPRDDARHRTQRNN